MLMRKGLLSSAGRSIVVTTVAVLVLTMGEPPTAAASSLAPASKGVSATTVSSDASDFSAAKPDETGAEIDPGRIAFLRSYVGAMNAAASSGVDVRGYFIWSLLDISNGLRDTANDSA